MSLQAINMHQALAVAALGQNIAEIALIVAAAIGVPVTTLLAVVYFGFEATKDGLVLWALYAGLLALLGDSADAVIEFGAAGLLYAVVALVQKFFFDSDLASYLQSQDWAMLLSKEDLSLS